MIIKISIKPSGPLMLNAKGEDALPELIGNLYFQRAIKGEKGDKGDPGVQGPKGDKGDTPDLSGYAKKTDLPAKVSQLSNDSAFITALASDLTNYYLKTQTYTRDEVQALVASIKTASFEVVDVLPATGQDKVIYLVPKAGESPDTHDEFIWVDHAWELIGNTTVDISNKLDKNGDASDTTVTFVQESGDPTSGKPLHSIIGRIVRSISNIVTGATKVGLALKADAATVDGAGNNIVAQYAAKTGTYPNMSVGNSQKFAGMNTLEAGLLNIGTYPGDYGHANNYVELISDIADTENVMFVMRLTGGSYSFGYVLDLTLMGYAYKDGSAINISAIGGYNTWWNNPLANADKIFAYMRGGKLCIAVQVPEVYSRLSGAIYAGRDAIMVNRIMGATQRSHDYILNTTANNIKWTVKPSTASLAVVDGGTYPTLTVGKATKADQDSNGLNIATNYTRKTYTALGTWTKAGWYRIYTSGVGAVIGENIILNLINSWWDTSNQALSLFISASTGTGANILQMFSGAYALPFSKIRVLRKGNEIFYIDAYYAVNKTNTIQAVQFGGTGAFNPAPSPGATIPDGYTVTEFDIKAGDRVMQLSEKPGVYLTRPATPKDGDIVVRVTD